VLITLLLVLPLSSWVQAVAAYTAQFLGNVTAYPDVFAYFLSKLLNYHFILRRCAACKLC
jgi:hypothetical protein